MIDIQFPAIIPLLPKDVFYDGTNFRIRNEKSNFSPHSLHQVLVGTKEPGSKDFSDKRRNGILLFSGSSVTTLQAYFQKVLS
jgi:hypothetical protein